MSSPGEDDISNEDDLLANSAKSDAFDAIIIFKAAILQLQATIFSKRCTVWSSEFGGKFILTHGGDHFWWISNYVRMRRPF